MSDRREIAGRSRPLRERAETMVEDGGALDLGPDEIRRLFHELRTHQIELEMQNEELRRAQVDLIESRDRYTDLYDFAPVGYLTLGESGSILEANLKAARMLRVERGGLVGCLLADSIVPEDQDIFHRHRVELLRTGDLRTCELRVGRAGADPIWVRLESMVAKEADGPGPQVRCIMIDVTRLRRAEDEQARLKRERLESLGLLAGGIAHDFNNLLTAIMCHADLALKRIPPSSLARESLDQIERASRQGAELCAQMLAYAGQGRLVAQGIDVSALVEETVQLLEPSVSKKAHLDVRLTSNLPVVLADAAQIRQVVMNLITNASEALGERGGRITISTGLVGRHRSAHGEGRLYGQLPDESVYLEVTDNGCGMNEEVQSKIFDPFFTTKFTGRGLGLAAVLGILQSHGGAARVASAPGEGTTFHVFLAASDRVAAEAPAAATAAGRTTDGGTILVVDDEEIIRTLLAGVLEDAGYEVLIAGGGREAIEIFRESHRSIGLVVLDLTMPNMSGEETFHELQGIRPDVRVLLSSGYSENGITERFSDSDLAGFIHKPYRSHQLIEKIRGILGDH